MFTWLPRMPYWPPHAALAGMVTSTAKPPFEAGTVANGTRPFWPTQSTLTEPPDGSKPEPSMRTTAPGAPRPGLAATWDWTVQANAGAIHNTAATATAPSPAPAGPHTLLLDLWRLTVPPLGEVPDEQCRG